MTIVNCACGFTIDPIERFGETTCVACELRSAGHAVGLDFNVFDPEDELGLDFWTDDSSKALRYLRREQRNNPTVGILVSVYPTHYDGQYVQDHHGTYRTFDEAGFVRFLRTTK